MKLFISYSRDDKHFVNNFWRDIRDKLRHDAWIDQDLLGSTRWWDEIVKRIKWADAFIIVVSPRSLSSPYCQAELDYAARLNKPILPLLLKPCKELPEALAPIQYVDVTGNVPMLEVLLRVSQSVTEIRLAIERGEVAPRKASPPPVPSADNLEAADEVYDLALDVLEQHNFARANELLQQIIAVDAESIAAELARDQLAKIAILERRHRDYMTVARLVERSRPDAPNAWRKYVTKYGTDYDPDNLASKFGDASGDGKPTITASADILPQPFAWMPIMAGAVTLEGHRGSYIPEGETKPVEVPAFAIAKYPVTNAQFAKFMDAGGYEDDAWWTPDGWRVKREVGWEEPRFWQDSQWNKPDYPVVGVSWYEAVAFCLWLSDATGEKIMLPTEQQWQRAAQGDTAWDYPWGPDWDGGRCNNSVDPYDSNSTTPVTQYEGRDKGDSPFGVVDMSGNVWEWCSTDWDVGRDKLSRTNERVLRGGSWFDHLSVNFRVRNRDGDVPDGWSFNDGFRCARSAK